MAELITPTAEREALGGGVYRTTVHLAPVAYADAGGVLRRIAADWSDGDGTYPHVVSAAKMRVRTAPNGDRLLLPVPGDDEAWFSISSPYINVGGNWVQPSLGSFTRTGHTLTAQTTNVDTRIDHAGHYIKAEFELKNGWTPSNGQFAFRVGLNGLTRDGGTLLYDGSPVMALRAPVAYDADNELDTRTIAHEFVQLGGNWYVLFTLPSLAGMARPVVDPTFSAQPDATAGVDTFVRKDASTTNYGTNTTLEIFGPTSTGGARVGLLKFDTSSIPGGATISSGTLSLWVVSFTLSGTHTQTASRILAANSGWTEGATWDYADGSSVRWAGDTGSDGGADAGCTVSGTDYSSTAMGTASFTSTDAAGTQKDFTLDADELALMVANNYGIAIIADGSPLARVDSSDSATAAERPQLVIEYSVGAAIPGLMQQYRRRRG